MRLLALAAGELAHHASDAAYRTVRRLGDGARHVGGGVGNRRHVDQDVIDGEKKWYVVLPAMNQGTYTLSVKVNNELKEVVVPAQYMNWQPGYEYTYIFKITDSGALVLYDVVAGFAPWDESVSPHPVFNW